MTLRPSLEARKYLGQRETKENGKGNAGFVNQAFLTEMIEEGWQKFWAWCCVLQRVVYVNSYPEHTTLLRKLFSPSVLTTLNNFRNAGFIVGTKPVIDSLAVWQSFKDGHAQITGHIGCVSSVDVNKLRFSDISGNTNSAGSREGDTCAEKDHSYDKEAFLVNNGLRLIGFIHVPLKLEVMDQQKTK